uniref:BLOC-1-related complex subunit 6 C-terminal helix domain-containing protein n=1 Tax=Acrobeloides nanus TaxID=290746 RepID=A0A914CYH9_9BILA
MQQPKKISKEEPTTSDPHNVIVQNIEQKVRDLCIQSSQDESPDLEAHARSISSNIDMVLRDLRGSLRGMSDLTLESMQTFSSSINSTCENMDSTIKSMYTLLAKAEELNSSMANVHKLTQQIKDMKRLVDLFETHFQNSLA